LGEKANAVNIGHRIRGKRKKEKPRVKERYVLLWGKEGGAKKNTSLGGVFTSGLKRSATIPGGKGGRGYKRKAPFKDSWLNGENGISRSDKGLGRLRIF